MGTVSVSHLEGGAPYLYSIFQKCYYDESVDQTICNIHFN